MSYLKTTWSDRDVEHPQRYTYTDDLTYLTVTAAPGTITNSGTDITAARMNKLESGVLDAYYMSAAPIPSTGSASYTFSGDDLQESNEYESGVLSRKISLTYSGGNIASENIKVYDTSATVSTVIRDWTIAYTFVGANIATTAVTVNV